MKLLSLFLMTLLAGAQTITTVNNEAMSTARGKINTNFTELNTYKVSGTAGGATDGQAMVYSGTGGYIAKKFAGTGLGLFTSGVLSVDSGLQFNTSTKSLGVFGPIVSGQTSNYLGQILLNGITSGTVTIQPANAAGTWTLTLPANDGDNGQVLQTNGSGVTSWAAAGSGSGNMVNTGTPTATALPKYSDTSGTAIAPSGVLVDSNNDVTGIRNLTITGTLSAGAAGAIDLTAITAPATPSAGVASVYIDSTTKRLTAKDDAGLVKPSVFLIASGSTALATASISANSCATVVTATATGAASTDVITFTPNASIKAVTGYTPAGMLTIVAYPTTNTVNFDVCNKDQSNAVTPGAVTLNWTVTR